MPRLFAHRVPVALAAGLVALASLTAHAKIDNSPARFSAVAMNLNRGAAGNIEIVVNRWSSDAARDRLMQALLDKGPDKLLDVLQDMPRMGYFRTPDSIGWDIHFARHTPT